MNKLVALMEANPDLIMSRSLERLEKSLNSVPGGVVKPAAKWLIVSLIVYIFILCIYTYIAFYIMRINNLVFFRLGET